MIRLYCAVRAAVKDGEQLGIASKASGVVITSVTWACGPTHRNEKPFIGCHPERRAQTGSPASTGFVLAGELERGIEGPLYYPLTLAWHDFRRSAVRICFGLALHPPPGQSRRDVPVVLGCIRARPSVVPNEALEREGVLPPRNR